MKQTFCIFHTCKRYACRLFWDSKKIHLRKHKTASVTHEYRLDRKEKLRKTGNKWKKLVTKSQKRGVKNVLGTSHWFIFFLNQQRCFEELSLQWNYLHLWTNQISVGISITGMHASHVRLMCKTYQSHPKAPFTRQTLVGKLVGKLLATNRTYLPTVFAPFTHTNLRLPTRVCQLKFAVWRPLYLICWWVNKQEKINVAS